MLIHLVTGRSKIRPSQKTCWQVASITQQQCRSYERIAGRPACPKPVEVRHSDLNLESSNPGQTTVGVPGPTIPHQQTWIGYRVT